MRIPIRRISEFIAWSFLLGILIVGVPLFICMPLWVDTTYHDLSAKNILRGGVHYRDIFETNLPGMVWVHAAIRPIIGWSSEAIRTADLFVVGTSILLLCFWLKRIGIQRSGLAWFLAASFFFYVYETEFIHCQRDSWMLLPTIVALHLRGRQLAAAATSGSWTIFRRGFVEGMAWACAVWIKPHCIVPAGFLWLTSVRRMIGTGTRRALADFLGLLAGGILIGGLGVIWLFATGAWHYMWDVLLNWNPEYYKWTFKEMENRVSMVLMYFAPWSAVHVAALPLALSALIRARVWQFGPIDWMKPFRMDQALLAALYLGWFAEAVFLQKQFHYSQAPVHFLAFAVVASHRWPVGPILITWCLLGATLNYYRPKSADLNSWLGPFQERFPLTYQQLVPHNKLINDDWREVWMHCVTKGSSPEIKDHLSFYRYIHPAPSWTDLDEVRQFLQTLDLKDGELVCWDDSTHPLYLDLNLRPAIRFMHVNTALEFASKRPKIREELIASGHKYVVSDFAVSRFLYEGYSMETPPGRPLDLPIEFPCFCRDVYPWTQPIIFKYGRYAVHRIEKPIGYIRIPYPLWLDKP